MTITSLRSNFNINQNFALTDVGIKKKNQIWREILFEDIIVITAVFIG